MNSLYAHDTRECVSDQDTMNIYGMSSPHMRVFQTTCTPDIVYHNWPLALTTVSLCALGRLLAVISIYQVVECLARIWRVAMVYRCLICIEGIVNVPGVYWT